MLKKSTKKKEVVAIDIIGKVVSEMTKIMEKNKKEVIDEMVASMKIQSDIISRARAKGIIVSEIMPEIKSAYEKLYTLNPKTK